MRVIEDDVILLSQALGQRSGIHLRPVVTRGAIIHGSVDAVAAEGNTAVKDDTGRLQQQRQWMHMLQRRHNEEHHRH